MTPAIEQLISSFATNLYAVVRAEMRAEVAAVLGDGVVRLSNGQVPHAPLPARERLDRRIARMKHVEPPKKARKKGPIQLCPVPGCRSPAAPIFRMLCAKHKNTPKNLVAKYREIRRAKAKKAA